MAGNMRAHVAMPPLHLCYVRLLSCIFLAAPAVRTCDAQTTQEWSRGRAVCPSERREQGRDRGGEAVHRGESASESNVLGSGSSAGVGKETSEDDEVTGEGGVVAVWLLGTGVLGCARVLRACA